MGDVRTVRKLKNIVFGGCEKLKCEVNILVEKCQIVQHHNKVPLSPLANYSCNWFMCIPFLP